MQKLDVLYMCDNAFAQIAGISLTSLFENNPSDEIALTVYLLLVQVSDENHQKFVNLANRYHQTIHLIDAAEAFVEISGENISTYRGSAMTNLRLYFDRFLPDSVQRILYLDCDTLICGSLSDLPHFDMNGKMLGMVLDAYGKLMKSPHSKGLSYYNAGVLLIDCAKWREGQWSSRILEYIRLFGARFPHPDQDIFNILCQKEIIPLPICYNFQTVHRMFSEKLYFRHLAARDYYAKEEISAARKKPVVLHMIRTFGSNPWNCNNIHPDTPLFSYYKEKSPWKEMPPVPLQQDFILRTEQKLYTRLPRWLFFPLSLWAIGIVQRIHKGNTY